MALRERSESSFPAGNEFIVQFCECVDVCVLAETFQNHHLKLFILKYFKNLSWAFERQKVADEGLGSEIEMQLLHLMLV